MSEVVQPNPGGEVRAVAAVLDAPPVPAASPVVAGASPQIWRWVHRAVWLGLLLAPVAVLATATFLVPSPSGHGTHQQLGLPPCGFLLITGLPCPGCGLTTAFAHMVRGEIVGAAHANPFGIVLFLTSACMIPVALVGMLRGSHVLDTLERFQGDKVAILLAATSITVWVVRVLTLLLS